MQCDLVKKAYSIITRSYIPAMNALKGRFISFNLEGKDNTIAFVKSVQDGKITYEIARHLFQTGPAQTTGQITLFYFEPDETAYVFCNDEEEEIFYAHKVKTTQPKSITAEHLTAEFSLFPEDENLEKILTRHLPERINNEGDLKDLTCKISQSIRLRPAQTMYDERKTPLGKVVAELGVECRHLAALEYVLLRLKMSRAVLVATNKKFAKSSQESHCFIHAFLNGRWFAVDPSNNFVVKLSELGGFLSKKNKQTHYHVNAEPLKFVFNY